MSAPPRPERERPIPPPPGARAPSKPPKRAKALTEAGGRSLPTPPGDRRTTISAISASPKLTRPLPTPGRPSVTVGSTPKVATSPSRSPMPSPHSRRSVNVTAAELNRQISSISSKKGVTSGGLTTGVHFNRPQPRGRPGVKVGGTLRGRRPPPGLAGSQEKRANDDSTPMGKRKSLPVPEASIVRARTLTSGLDGSKQPLKRGVSMMPSQSDVVQEESAGGKWKRGAEAEAIMELLRAEASKARPAARTVEVANKPDPPPVPTKPPIPAKPNIPPKGIPPPIPQKASTPDLKPAKRSMKGISSTDVQPVTDTNTEGKWKRSAQAEALLSMLQAEASQSQIEELIKAKVDEEVKAPEPEPEKKATDPVEELLMTERNFVYDLDNVLNTFVKPLRERDVIPSSLVDEFSLNFDCLADFHKHLFGKMSQGMTLADLVGAFGPEMLVEMEKLYTVYMGNYERILALFYEKRDNNAGLRKFLKSREDTSSKSVNNLLVTPMQRACKYELMLASIVRMKQKEVERGTLPEGEDPKKVLEECDMLQARVEEIGVVLQNVDRRRQAADIWEDIVVLEQSLLVSEPLAKVGRKILVQKDVIMKVFGCSSTTSSADTFKLVLFNDLLVRTKVPKKGKKGRVLDQVLPSSIQLVDMADLSDMPEAAFVASTQSTHPNSREMAITYRLMIINSDPAGSVFEVHAADEAEKTELKEALTGLIPSQSKFWNSWGISERGADRQAERLFTADDCQWSQAFVKQCRVYITSSYLCLLWKVYGRVERMKIPLDAILFCTKEKRSATSKSGTIEVKTNTWKQCYRFTEVQNCDLTFAILEHAIAMFKERMKGSQRLKLTATKSELDLDLAKSRFSSLLMSGDDWNAVWQHGASQTYKKNAVILSMNPTLCLIIKGSVRDASNPAVTFSAGQLFGVKAFLTGEPGETTMVSSADKLDLLSFDRKQFGRHVKDPQLQSRFFALLAMKLASS